MSYGEEVMDFHVPWCVSVGKVAFDPTHMKTMLDEIMEHPEIMANVQVGSLRISDRYDEFRHCTNFIHYHLKRMMKTYCLEQFGRDPKEITWSAWVHTCFNGTGLVPHYHMGDEHLTSILYLTESKANLVLRDPRANMVRNWPQDILKFRFADHVVTPRTGDFVIFPTYIDHYVMAAEPDFRVSIAIDWCFK